MNSTFFFTDFAKQAREYQRLKSLKTARFIGLYGNASILAAAELSADDAAVWQTLCRHDEVYVCPSAARRRGIAIAQPASPRPGLRWLSLASILERLAADDSEVAQAHSRAISVGLITDSDLARTEALELCLAALALDFYVQLSLSGAGIAGLQRSLARVGAKGYASLAMFGLPHAFIAASEIATFKLTPDALSLPWQVGAAVQVPLMFKF